MSRFEFYAQPSYQSTVRIRTLFIHARSRNFISHVRFLMKDLEKAEKVFNQNKKLNQGRRPGIQETEAPTQERNYGIFKHVMKIDVQQTYRATSTFWN